MLDLLGIFQVYNNLLVIFIIKFRTKRLQKEEEYNKVIIKARNRDEEALRNYNKLNTEILRLKDKLILKEEEYEEFRKNFEVKNTLQNLKIEIEEEKDEKVYTQQEDIGRYNQSQDSQLSELKQNKIDFGIEQNQWAIIFQNEKSILIKALRNALKVDRIRENLSLCLENVDLSENFRKIASGLKANLFIKELNINNTNLRDEDLEVWRKMLKVNKTVEKLRFKGNNFTSSGLESFFNSLIGSENNIRLLDISGYSLGNNCILALKRFLDKTKEFNSLFIQNCIVQNQMYNCKCKSIIVHS